MFKLFFIIIQLQAIVLTQDIDTLFDLANESYIKKNFLESSKTYELILKEGYHSTDLYMNLGNSYYFLEEFGNSRWSYEMGMKLSPFDKDLIYNYDKLIKSVTNVIEPPKNNLLDFIKIFLQSFSLNMFVFSTVCFFFIFSFLTFLYKILKVNFIKVLSYILLSLLVVNILLVSQKKFGIKITNLLLLLRMKHQFFQHLI
tara:strand:+ start:4618 stop:5217 length:600 start_codon:yes stop_codon:yes gene_type:complete